MGGQRRGKAVERKQFETAADMARALPHLFRPISESPALTGEENDVFAQCEAAVETLRVAFWAAGKALHIIRDGRLYRASHSSFEAYVHDRWAMEVRYANKLIKTWPIADQLLGQAQPMGTLQRANQAQMWELVPIADRWDTDAAAYVYRTLLEVDGVTVTAALIKDVVDALARIGDDFDRRAAATAIREQLDLAAAGDDDQDVDYAVRAQKAVPLRWLRQVAQKDRAGAAAYLDHVQQQIDTARAELLASAE